MAKSDRAKEIRELRALVPANNVCINCLSKAPGYVCLTFGTFVCTKCASVHRFLLHNIRSITLSTLTDAEMEAMRAGGNENAAKVWFANWSEAEMPRPSSEDEAALRKFIRAVYTEELWKLGSAKRAPLPGGMMPVTQGTVSAMDPQAALYGSYAAVPPSSQSQPMDYTSAIRTPSVNVTGAQDGGSTGGGMSNFAPIDLSHSLSPPSQRQLPQDYQPASQQAMPQHIPLSFGASSDMKPAKPNPFDLISWDESPAANTMPSAQSSLAMPPTMPAMIAEPIAEQQPPPRRQVQYHVQHSTSPDPAQPSPAPMAASVSVPAPAQPYSAPPSATNADATAAELQIKQLQDMLAAQQRQFQHQLQESQLQQRQLQQQLQHQQIQSQMAQQQMMMSKQVGQPTQPQVQQQKVMTQQPAPRAGLPTATAGQQPIYVLGPNGQLVPVMPAPAPGGIPQATTSPSPMPPKQPSPQMSFVPMVGANGQAMMAPPSSPLMTMGASTPASLPPGSIGPHYVPAPGGGFQAVYMVPTGVLPPGAAKKTTIPQPVSTVQKPTHGPIRYDKPPTSAYPGAYTGVPSAYPNLGASGNKQEDDDFALALRLQREEDEAASQNRGDAGQRHVSPPPAAPASRFSARMAGGPGDSYFQDAQVVNASYIANDEELARQLAAAELSDEEES